MSNSRTVIRRTRSVRDLYRNKRFTVLAVSPGGRTIVKAKAATRRRAFKEAARVNTPQTSPTAAATSGGYTGTGVAPGDVYIWQEYADALMRYYSY